MTDSYSRDLIDVIRWKKQPIATNQEQTLDQNQKLCLFVDQAMTRPVGHVSSSLLTSGGSLFKIIFRANTGPAD